MAVVTITGDRLIDYLRFYVPLKNISLIWRRHHCRWRAAKFRPMLGAQGLWAGRDLYRATPAVTRDLGFSGLIRRTAPFSRLLRHTRGFSPGSSLGSESYIFQFSIIHCYLLNLKWKKKFPFKPTPLFFETVTVTKIWFY